MRCLTAGILGLSPGCSEHCCAALLLQALYLQHGPGLSNVSATCTDWLWETRAGSMCMPAQWGEGPGPAGSEQQAEQHCTHLDVLRLPAELWEPCGASPAACRAWLVIFWGGSGRAGGWLARPGLACCRLAAAGAAAGRVKAHLLASGKAQALPGS